MTLRESIKRNWFFQDFADAQIDTLLDLGQDIFYPAGEKVLIEGEPLRAFYVLIKGAVSIKMRLAEHGELVLSTLKETGEIFGWSALVEEGRSTATAECLEETRVLSFAKKDTEDLFRRNPTLGYRFMKRLAILISRRLQNTRALLVKEIS